MKSMIERGQAEFGFASEVQMIVRRAVESLNRFSKAIILESPSAYAWDGSVEVSKARIERCRKAAASGLRSIGYEEWLRWYSPLCSTGETVREQVARLGVWLSGAQSRGQADFEYRCNYERFIALEKQIDSN